MAKRPGALGSKKKSRSKKSPKRLAVKKRMLEIRAMKPSARRKALSGM